MARWFTGRLSTKDILDYFDRQESESLRNSKGTLEEIRAWDRKRFGGFDAELLLSAAEREKDDTAIEKLFRHLEEVAPIADAGILARIRRVGNRSSSESVGVASASAYLRLARNEIQATTGREFTMSLFGGAELNKAIQQHAWSSGYASAIIDMKEPFEMRSVKFAAYSIEEQQYIVYEAQKEGNDVVINRVTDPKPGTLAFKPILYLNARLEAVDVRGNLSERVDDLELIGQMNGFPTGAHQGLFAHTHIHFQIQSETDHSRVFDERMGHLVDLSAISGSVQITELTDVRFMRRKDLVSPSEIDPLPSSVNHQNRYRNYDPIKMVSWPKNQPRPSVPDRKNKMIERGTIRVAEESSPESYSVHFLRLDNHEGIGKRSLDLMKRKGIKAAALPESALCSERDLKMIDGPVENSK